jgi:hypothetical protein
MVMLKLLLYFVMIVVGADHSLTTWTDASLTQGRVYVAAHHLLWIGDSCNENDFDLLRIFLYTFNTF